MQSFTMQLENQWPSGKPLQHTYLVQKTHQTYDKVLSGSKYQYLVQNLLRDIYDNDMHPCQVNELV